MTEVPLSSSSSAAEVAPLIAADHFVVLALSSAVSAVLLVWPPIPPGPPWVEVELDEPDGEESDAPFEDDAEELPDDEEPDELVPEPDGPPDPPATPMRLAAPPPVPPK